MDLEIPTSLHLYRMLSVFPMRVSGLFSGNQWEGWIWIRCSVARGESWQFWLHPEYPHEIWTGKSLWWRSHVLCCCLWSLADTLYLAEKWEEVRKNLILIWKLDILLQTLKNETITKNFHPFLIFMPLKKNKLDYLLWILLKWGHLVGWLLFFTAFGSKRLEISNSNFCWCGPDFQFL